MAFNIEHQYEENPLACGQAVLAMLSGKTQSEIFRLVGTCRETDLKTMKNTIESFGLKFAAERKAVTDKSELPVLALLSLETPKCWHWSLYFKGEFFDPEYGKTEEFPPSLRRYYWELSGF